LQHNYVMHVGSRLLSIKTLLIFSTLFDGVLNVLLIILYQKAQRARYGLQYFSPLQFRTLMALSDVLIQGEPQIISSYEVAQNVDRYMGSFLGKTKWISKLAITAIEIYPLIFLKPPASYMRPEDRKQFLERHFYQDVALRMAPPFIAMLVQAMIRMGKQLCFMGYYNDPRVHPSIGYVPFSQRADSKKRLADLPYETHQPLEVWTEKDVKGDTLDWEGVVIIGTGPGASIMAKGLAERQIPVLMIERGVHTDPADFNEDEIDMVSRLYADGALQLAADFRFQVIQGSTVGGSSVVNNAVCFDTPDSVLNRWNEKDGINAGLDLDQYKQCNKEVNRMIGVSHIDDTPTTMSREEYLNPGGQKFKEGIQRLGLDQAPNIMDSVSANIRNCVGCGYCNIGCRWGKKLSMLSNILPAIQKKAGADPFRIIAGCEVIKLKSKGARITSLIGQFRNGRKIEVRANTFVIAAGAISSSILLQRSGIAEGRAGKHLSFNLGSPISAVFPEVINSYRGLQISHFLELFPNRGFIFETWFNPPMFQSTIMPGWWDDHWKNMHRYNRMAATGVLVGTESNAEVRIAGLTHREVRYQPTKQDFETLLDGLILAGDIYFAAGAECVMPNTFKYYEYGNSAQLKRLKDDVKDNSDITLGTGHPQGGNILSRDPKLGVVDEHLKVYGYNNLFISDASVFPTAIGVNPQITVMTFAHYAVPFVAETLGSVRVIPPAFTPA
jgi:choline dehydrogenase-like flavoprotein